MPTVYFDDRSHNAEAILADLNVKVVAEPADADLIWLRGKHRRYLDALRPNQLINYIAYIAGESAMIDKEHLAENLNDFDRQSDIPMNDYFPETYCLEDPHDRDAFFDQLPEEDSEDNLWILKPADMSKGLGVRVLWKFDVLRQVYAAQYAPKSGSSGDQTRDGEEWPWMRPYVIQRYIKNPLLLKGRKSEIRLYWFIPSVDPLMVLLYGEGTVRLNNKPFQLGDFDNELVHVTNVFQQKRHPDFDPSLELKWSFSDLQSYLSGELGIAHGNFIEGDFKPKLKKSLSLVLDATRQKFRPHTGGGLFFGLYGVDVILDDAVAALGNRDTARTRTEPYG